MDDAKPHFTEVAQVFDDYHNAMVAIWAFHYRNPNHHRIDAARAKDDLKVALEKLGLMDHLDWSDPT
jgi:hypothetical protein